MPNKNREKKARFVIISFIRALLIVAFFGALQNSRDLVLVLSIFGFSLTFLPKLLRKYLGVSYDSAFDVMTLFFIYGILYLSEVRGVFANFWWWGILLNLISAFALGFIGLIVIYSLYEGKKISTSPFFIAFFAFVFALSFATLWEILEFLLDVLFGFNLQSSTLDTMGDLIVGAIGSFLVSAIGYLYIKNGKVGLINGLISSIINKNPGLFKDKSYAEKSSEEIMGIIKKGEGERLEFKSTLRTNLHTGSYDKKIEHSVLKTVVAYLNSYGGTLLVGVSDGGNILGLEKDGFVDNDALSLHFTNLIRHRIGNEYLPFIRFEIFPINDKHVLKIDCDKSNRHVFLKDGDEEEFYVRNGPASVKLSGNALVDYISHKFGR